MENQHRAAHVERAMSKRKPWNVFRFDGGVTRLLKTGMMYRIEACV
jgi:hypothetical protein